MKKLLLLSHSLFLTPCFLFSQNIGIGTNTPTARFEVAGLENTAHGKNAGINLKNTSSSNVWTLRAGGTGTATPTGGFSIGDNLAYRLTIMSTGDVGIGTTTPQQMLSVSGGMNIDQNNVNAGNTTNALRFGSNSGEAIGSKRTSGANLHGLDFYTSDQRRMAITNQGRVGINNSTPSSRLTIYHESPVDARGDAYEEHGFMIIDSSWNTGIAALYMGLNVVTNRAYITFNNSGYAGGNVEPKLFINPMGNTTFIGGGWGSQNVPYKLVVGSGDANIEGSLFVEDGKGIIRNTTSAQLKQVVTSVQVNGPIAGGTTLTQGVVWSQNFIATPVAAYVGNVTGFTTGGWAELILTIFNAGTSGCTLYIHNPRAISVTAGFTFNIIAIGQ